MKLPRHLIAGAMVLASTAAFAGTAVSDMHPEEAIPDNLPPLLASPAPDAELIKQVQEELHAQGFDAGPVNGDFGTKTQAALAQYQLAMTLPATGMLDEDTLRALGVQRPSAGSCDALVGPDKEQCLHEGGTIEAGMRSESGAAGSTSSR